MERIDLPAYPMPPGAPRLMPFQDQAFNGDGYLAAEILRLKEAHGITTFFETGTCLGSTTLWACGHFEQVYSVEANVTFHDIAIGRMRKTDTANWLCYLDDSVTLLQFKLGAMGDDTLFFLDAHWGDTCPLLREIEAISDKGIRPVIVIHDFYVPGRPDLGYDHFPDGRPFKLENVSASLDRVYGPEGWDFHYNDRAEGAKRGVLFVTPRG